MEDLYVQCEFVNGNAKTVAWIEKEHAVVGNSGKFKDVGDGKRWEIVSVGNTVLPKSQIDRKNETFITHAHPTNKMRGNK